MVSVKNLKFFHPFICRRNRADKHFWKRLFWKISSQLFKNFFFCRKYSVLARTSTNNLFALFCPKNTADKIFLESFNFLRFSKIHFCSLQSPFVYPDYQETMFSGLLCPNLHHLKFSISHPKPWTNPLIFFTFLKIALKIFFPIQNVLFCRKKNYTR